MSTIPTVCPECAGTGRGFDTRERPDGSVIVTRYRRCNNTLHQKPKEGQQHD